MTDKTVLIKAKNVKVGDMVCFSTSHFTVEDIDERDAPFPQVRFRHGSGLSMSAFDPDEFLYVIRSTRSTRS